MDFNNNNAKFEHDSDTKLYFNFKQPPFFCSNLFLGNRIFNKPLNRSTCAKKTVGALGMAFLNPSERRQDAGRIRTISPAFTDKYPDSFSSVTSSVDTELAVSFREGMKQSGYQQGMPPSYKWSSFIKPYYINDRKILGCFRK